MGLHASSRALGSRVAAIHRVLPPVPFGLLEGLHGKYALFQLVACIIFKNSRTARPVHQLGVTRTIQLITPDEEELYGFPGRRNLYENRNVDQWCDVRLFDWRVGHGMGMVAQK